MKNSRVIFALILMLTPFLFCASEETDPAQGRWEGNITLKPGMELGVAIDLIRQDGAWKGEIDIPAQAAKDLPLASILVTGKNAEFEIAGIPGKPTFKGSVSDDGNALSGQFTQAGQAFPFSLKRGEKKPEIPQRSESEILGEIRERVKATMPDWHVPGIALAIIKDGKVIFSEGFGVKDTKSNQPVTPETLFAIGSSSKAFTASVMGTVVDEGKIKWDDHIKDFVPTFKMQDSFAGERMTPKDLLTHRSGLPRHDVVWYGSPLSRKELFDRLKYLEPTEDFRTVFQYQNLMFMTAGYVEEQLTRRTGKHS